MGMFFNLSLLICSFISSSRAIFTFIKSPLLTFSFSSPFIYIYNKHEVFEHVLAGAMLHLRTGGGQGVISVKSAGPMGKAFISKANNMSESDDSDSEYECNNNEIYDDCVDE